uniref:Uncharacterized protein n=1 Tax=Nymphaea colorata TaxID=210225 RepID=A0A5K0XXS9_9MAGN
MEKQGRKRLANRSEEEEVKNARAKTIDDEVEEFFALIRRIRATSRPAGKDSHRSPSFRWEDFAATASAGAKASSSDGGSGRPSEPSSTDESGEVVEGEDKEEPRPEGGEDNGIPACLDLSLGLCGGSRGQFLMERTVGSSARGGIISRCHISDRS